MPLPATKELTTNEHQAVVWEEKNLGSSSLEERNNVVVVVVVAATNAIPTTSIESTMSLSTLVVLKGDRQ
jgi:hypothetical protein